MMNSLAKLAQKPSDKNIRIVRFVFALLLTLVIYFGSNVTEVNFGLPTQIIYALYVFPLIGFIRAVLDPGIFRKGIWKWAIVTLGGIMLITSLIFIDDTTIVSPSPATTVSGEIDIATIAQDDVDHAFTLSTDNWFGFFGFILILVGYFLNNKNITLKNERYGEKVTKIRV